MPMPHCGSAIEVDHAIELAEDSLRQAGSLADFRLLRDINLVGPDPVYRGPALRATPLQSRPDMVPGTADEELGAGGEIFVDVDTAAATAIMAGCGE